MITFKTRARHKTIDCAKWRIWDSLCGRYRVIESTPLFGRPRSKRDRRGYAKRWLAERRTESGGWDWVERFRSYRSRRAAEQACIDAAGGGRRRQRQSSSQASGERAA